MENEESKELLLKLLALADKMEQRDARVIDQLSAEAKALRLSAQAVQEGGDRFARRALDILQGEGRTAIHQGLGQALEESSGQLRQSSLLASRAADEVQASATRLKKQRNLWLWGAPLGLIAGSLLAVGGSTWWTLRNLAELERVEFSRDILRATQTGAITQCGRREQLCVKVGAQTKTFGAQGEYLLLED